MCALQGTLYAHRARSGPGSYVQLLLQGALGPVPDVELATITPLSDVSRVKALCEAAWIAPFRGDHHIVAWLVPEIIPKSLRGRWGVSSFPALLDFEGFGIERDEACAAGLEPILGRPTSHEGHDDLFWGAVRRVWQSHALLGQKLAPRDGLVDLRGTRVCPHVDDVDVAGQDAGSDEEGMCRPARLKRGQNTAFFGPVTVLLLSCFARARSFACPVLRFFCFSFLSLLAHL